MYIGFIIVVLAGNLVCGENGTEFIESLPENEKAELLEEIGERISRQVPMNMEVNETQVNEFDGLVGKILNEEKYHKPKLIIKETSSVKPMKKKKINVLRTLKPDQNESKGDSKIITIPFRLHDSAINYITRNESVDSVPLTPVPIEIITEQEQLIKNISNVSGNTSQESIVTNLTSVSLNLDPATEKIVGRSEDLIILGDNKLNTTKYDVSVDTVTSPIETIVSITEKLLLNDTTNLRVDKEVLSAETVRSPISVNVVTTPIPNDTPKEEVVEQELVTTTMKESTIASTQKPIEIDTISPLITGDALVSTEKRDNEEIMKITKERTQDQEAAFADEAKIMSELYRKSTQNPIDVIIQNTVGENGEGNFRLNENNKTTHKDEAMIKIRRHTNNLGKQDNLLHLSRRSESNKTSSNESHNKHPWSQNQRIQYLRNFRQSSNLTNSLLDSNSSNSNESVSIQKSDNNTSDNSKEKLNIGHKKIKIPTNNNKLKKISKNIHRHNLGMPFSDENLSAPPWSEYPIVDDHQNPFEKDFYPEPIHNASSVEVLQNLLQNSVLNNTHYPEEKYLVEDTTHIYKKPRNPLVKYSLNDPETTSHTILDETTPILIANDVQTIKLPNNTTEDKNQSLENHKILTEESRPLNPNPTNKTDIPPGLVESLLYPKIKKKHNHKRKPLKLHITSGSNPVNIRIFYDRNYKNSKKFKISLRDNTDYSYLRPDNRFKFKNQWPRRNFGDRSSLYVPNVFPSNTLEYTTLPSYLYAPPMSYQPTYYKQEIPYALFPKFKKNPSNKKQETYVLNNGPNGKYFEQTKNPNIPPNLEVYKGQYTTDDETNKITTQEIINEITKFLDQAKKPKKRIPKVTIRNDRYLKNPLRCKFGKSRRSGNGNNNDSTESDCRSSEEDDNAAVSEDSNESSKLITLIAVMSKKKTRDEFEDREVFNLNKPGNKANAYPYSGQVEKDKKKSHQIKLLDSPMHKKQQQIIQNKAHTYVQSHENKKAEDKCPKAYNINIYVEIIGKMVMNEDDALRRFDWLRSTIDIQASIQKLLIISNKLTRNEYIHPADLELLRFMIYLRKLSVQRGLERKTCQDKKKNVPAQESQYKMMQKADWMLYGRTHPYNMNRQLYDYYNNQNNDVTEVLDFIRFLNVLQTELYDLHSVIKHISLVTKFNNQNWFGDIKSLYLDYANRQDLLGVLLHLSFTKVVDYVEDNAKNGLSYNYIQYVIDHQEETLDIVHEFDFCSILANEMKKNIYIN